MIVIIKILVLDDLMVFYYAYINLSTEFIIYLNNHLLSATFNSKNKCGFFFKLLNLILCILFYSLYS